MSETLEHAPASLGADGSHPANPLRALREASGLHVAALAALLKVPVQRLEALEAGRYDDLPDMTFARALASSVCRVLKADPAPILATLPSTQSVRLGASDKDLNTPFRETTSGGRSSAPSANRVTFKFQPAWLAAALVVLAAVLWWALPPSDVPESTAVVRTPLPEGDTPTPAPVPVPSEVAPVAEAPAVPSATPPNAPPEPAGQPVLRLAARDTVWIEVVGARDKLLLQRNLQAGESVEFVTDAPYRVTSGRADAVEVTVRGQALDVLTKARNNVARFEVQ